MSAEVIAVERLTAGYIPGIDIITDLEFRAADGHITAIIGANGSGKSTLLKTIAGYLTPHRGEILFRGHPITGQPPESLLRRGIAYVPQQAKNLFPEMSVHENLELGCWIFRRDRKRMKAAIERVYDHFPFLAARRYQAAGAMSGGQQRILELERALLVDPHVLMLDEPTATLAPAIANDVYRRVASMRASGVSVILVDQNVRKAVEIADHLYVLELGATQLHGDTQNLSGRLREIIQSWLSVDRAGDTAGGAGSRRD